MSSLSSINYYKDLRKMSPIRAMAEQLLNNSKVKKISITEAYELAKKQPGVAVTDRPIYPKFAEKVGLPSGAKILNDTHGRIIGRTAKARKFYDRMDASDKRKVSGDLREAIFEMEQHKLIKAEAVLGLDEKLMIKATFITTESDVNNIFNWLANFTPFELKSEEYAKSKKLPIQDIIIIAFNEWKTDDDFYHKVGSHQLSLVDEKHNVIFNLGMRYFGERKKGTLTLAWTSGMRLGKAASHGGIKEIDFTTCKEEKYHELGKRSIAFYGLSGTGKSSHTNSFDNKGTLPEGFKKVILHDDAFQIDIEDKTCKVWEPSLFDKTDQRDLDNPDWKYMIATMNHGLISRDGMVLPVGQDIRQGNGRTLIDRDLLGSWVNSCSFPKALCWLMKDTTLPPIIKYTDNYLAVAMGASLITKRTRAENVKESELNKLVFEPFANPFRVYKLHKDVEAFLDVIEHGSEVYCFNSSAFWNSSEDDLNEIELRTSLTLQTAILTDQLEWKECKYIPGAQIPTNESIKKIIPDYYPKYNFHDIKNVDNYLELLHDRFRQRIDFLHNSDLKEKPKLLSKILKSLSIHTSNTQ